MIQDELSQISRSYPDLQIYSARQLTNSGQFSNIIIVNTHLIFRFPRSQYVAHEMLREVNLLSALKGSLSLPIPDPIYLDIDPHSKAVRFMGYEALAGEPMSANMLAGQPQSIVQPIAKQLAEFLRKLHAIPSTTLNIDLSIGETRDEWQNLYEAFREKLYPFMRPDAQAQVSANIETALTDPTLWNFTPVLRHGDFGTSNLLYDPQTMQVTGVIDFTSCGLGDPAQDVGAVWSLGNDLMPYFLDYYPEMMTTLRRVEFMRGTYALQQALYALRDGNKDDFEDGLRDYRAP